MHLILTGATGMVGSAVLDAMIKMKDITKISVISRRPVKMVEDAKDPRVSVIIHKDFENYDDALLAQLKGASGVVWALGISQMQVSKEEYTKITKDYALAAASAFEQLSSPTEPFRFVYVSGEGTTHTPGRFTPIFGRTKGETELALAEMRKANPTAFLASSVRPGGVDPSQQPSIKSYIPPTGMAMKAASFALLPIIRSTMKNQWTPTEPMGKFLAEFAMGKWDAEAAKGGDGVEKIGDFPVVANAGMRRISGAW